MKSGLSLLLVLVLVFQTLGPGLLSVKDAIAQTIGTPSTSNPIALVVPCTTTTLYSDGKTLADNPDGRTESPADELTTIHPGWTADVDGADTFAKWIWSENPVTQADTQVDTKKNFYRVFTVSGTTTSAQITLATDNFYQVWVNGTLAGAEQTDSDNFTLATQDTIDTTALLVPGQNVLKIEVTNQGVPGSDPASNPAGLLYALTYTIGNCSTGGGGGGPIDPGTSNIHLRKYIDGAPAATSTFTVRGDIAWGTGFTYAGDLTLGPKTDYHIETVSVTNGNNSSQFSENTGGTTGVIPFGAPCEAGKFRVVGYTYGSSFDQAKKSSATTTANVVLPINITSNVYIIVWNETCPTPAPLPQLSTVTLCKEDETGNRLDGWELSLSSASHAFSTTTKNADNGCAIFTGVPFSNYSINEVAQAGWENVSGLGLQTIASTSQTHIVVNRLMATSTCTVNCSTTTGGTGGSGGGGGNGGGGSPTTPTSGLTASRSGGGGSGGGNGGGGAPALGEVAGAFSAALPEGEVLGEFTDTPGIPNTGLGISSSASKNLPTGATVFFGGLMLLLLSNFIVLRKVNLA